MLERCLGFLWGGCRACLRDVWGVFGGFIGRAGVFGGLTGRA